MSSVFARGSGTWLMVAASVELFTLALFLGFMDLFLVNLVFLLATGWFAMVLWFFRDPEREIAPGIVAPADGLVTDIQELEDEDIGKRTLKIVTFMNVHNVHVNRAPLAGSVVSTTHRPGSHIPAFDKDSDRNERQVTILDTEIGRVKLVQIAGTVARRIVPYVSAGEQLAKGERYGIILFGSRVDLYLPADRVRLTVKKGNKPRAGMTTVAELVEHKAPERPGN